MNRKTRSFFLIALIFILANGFAETVEPEREETLGERVVEATKKLPEVETTFFTTYNNHLGVYLGYPMGLYYKRFFGSAIAASLTVGWRVAENFDAALNIFHNAYFFSFPLYVYFGGGVNAAFEKNVQTKEYDFSLSLRVPIGVEYQFKRFALFAELAPGIGLYPATRPTFGGGAGGAVKF